MSIVFALLSAAVYGVGDWLGGRASRVQKSLVVATLGQTVSLVMVGAIVLVAGTSAPGVSTWCWAAGGGIVGSLGIVGLYHGLAHGDVSVVAPVSAVVGAAVPVVVGLASGERPGVLAIVGIVVAVAAVALTSTTRRVASWFCRFLSAPVSGRCSWRSTAPTLTPECGRW